MTNQRTAWGWGLASVDAAGNTLDVWYPELKLGEAPEEVSRPNHGFGNLAHEGTDARGVRRIPVFTISKPLASRSRTPPTPICACIC